MSFLFNKSVSNASKEVRNAANEARNLVGSNSDLRTHHPASFGATVNSIRLTSDTVRQKIENVDFGAAVDSARLTSESMRQQIDSIDLNQIKLAACLSGVVNLGIGTQNMMNRKRLTAAIEKIAASTEKIATLLERKANADDAGGKGLAVQLLDFANLVASQYGTRVILAYHPSNIPQAGLQRVLFKSAAQQWPHIRPDRCILVVFDDWQELVSRLVIIRDNLHPGVPEPISIIFPATSHYVLRNFCHLPGDVDPHAVSFHGQTDSNGMPFTWLSGDMMMDINSIYQLSGIHNLGFISEITEPNKIAACFFAVVAGCVLCMALACMSTEPPAFVFLGIIFLIFLVVSLSMYEGETYFVRHIRDGRGGLIMNRSRTLEQGVLSDGSYAVDTKTVISRSRLRKYYARSSGDDTVFRGK